MCNKTKMDNCEVVRNHFRHDREFCLYPDRVHDGLIQIATIAYAPGVTIPLHWLDRDYSFQVWTDLETMDVFYQPGNIRRECFYIRDLVSLLSKHNKEAMRILLYGLFFNAKRRIYAAYVAAADTAYVATAAAAYAAADAAAYVATGVAADIYAAAYVYTTNAAAAAAHKYIKEGIKALFKVRRRSK